MALEAHRPRFVTGHERHPEALRPGQWAEPPAQVHDPCPVPVSFGPGDDVEPRRIPLVVGDPREHGFGGVWRVEGGGLVHGPHVCCYDSSCACSPTLSLAPTAFYAQWRS